MPEGQRLTPSVVHFPGGDAAPVVGQPANRVRVLKPAQTVYSIKRFMGRRGAEISREEMLVTYPVRGEGAGPVTVDIRRPALHARGNFRGDFEKIEGATPKPAWANRSPAPSSPCRPISTTRSATPPRRPANWPALPSNASSTSRPPPPWPTVWTSSTEHSKIAVYDLGGGTFDLSILEFNDGVFQVLSTNGNTRLGGDDLDKRAGRFHRRKNQGRRRPGCRAGDLPMLSRIRETAEQAKIRLSTEEAAEIALPFLTPDFHFHCTLTRAELEDLTRDIIARTRPHCLRSLADAKLEAKDLDQVILVGGQTRMPLVRRMVSGNFWLRGI